MRLPKLRLPGKLVRFAYRFIDVEASGEAAPPDGRMIEYSFIIGKLGCVEKGRVLDVGCTARLNFLPAALASLGWEVWGIDTREFKFKHPNFQFVGEDIRHTRFPDNFFDAIYAASTLEHIGLSGRYGIMDEDPKGDIKSVNEIRRMLCEEGTLLVTLPYGKKQQVIKQMNRVYDKQSLNKLFHGWEIKEEILYTQDSDGFWMPISEVLLQRDVRENREVIALLELGPQI